jgi:hypothetical protein
MQSILRVCPPVFMLRYFLRRNSYKCCVFSSLVRRPTLEYMGKNFGAYAYTVMNIFPSPISWGVVSYFSLDRMPSLNVLMTKKNQHYVWYERHVLLKQLFIDGQKMQLTITTVHSVNMLTSFATLCVSGNIWKIKRLKTKTRTLIKQII